MKKIALITAVFVLVALLAACETEKMPQQSGKGNTSSQIAQTESQITSSEIASSEIESGGANYSSTISLTPQLQTHSVSSQTPSKPAPKPTAPGPNLENMKAKNSQKAQEIINKVSAEGMTDVEKIKATYKWLYPNFKYRTAEIDLSDGFTEKLETELVEYYFRRYKGSCEHYAAVQKIFINELGYECMYVSGERYSAISHKWGEHIWLMTNINGNWYHVDGLFGGLFYNVIETTFMVPDSALEKTHRWDREKYPACTQPQLLK